MKIKVRTAIEGEETPRDPHMIPVLAIPLLNRPDLLRRLIESQLTILSAIW